MKIYDSLEKFDEKDNTIITIGNFDGLHRGHKELLSFMTNKAKDHKLKSLVVTFDPMPRKYLQPRCPYSQLLLKQEKIRLFEEKNLDILIIIPFDAMLAKLKYEQFIEEILINGLNMHTLIMGFDHKIGYNGEGCYRRIKRLATILGFDLQHFDAFHPRGEIISSSKIREYLTAGDIEKANELLGYKFFVSGEVIEGKRIGRKLGFPTANIKASKYKLIPKSGVYFVHVRVDDTLFNGILSIGTNPSISVSEETHIEVHILDFDENIYGKIIEVRLLTWLRDTKSFDSTEQLRLNIAYDVTLARKYFNILAK
ncbi:MAG: bifunctional riboflavin kinase/FAD synthetase [Bacteroidales bacterium]